MPPRAQAQARRRRDRRQRAHDHRLRRFAFLILVATVLVATLALTAFSRGASTGPDGMTPASPARLLPAGPPDPAVVAKVNGLRIQLPIASSRITAVGFQASSDGSLPLEPVGRRGNEGVLARAARWVFGGGGEGRAWYQLSGGSGPPTGGLDVGAPAGTDVYSPVDGTVVGLTPFVIDGRPFGSRVDIQPATAPSVVLTLSHLRVGPHLSVGDDVEASLTRLGSVVDVSGVEQQALAAFTNDAGNHVVVEVRPAANLALG